MQIAIKRVYEAPAPDDGTRVLVDRLWPRGLTKEQAGVHVWLRDVAPSDALRKWYGHEPEKWSEFKRRYFAELDGKQEAVDELRAYLEQGRLTLLYAARQEAYNNAVALKEYLCRNGPGAPGHPAPPSSLPPR